MKDSKGITMATLVVMIASIVLLSTMAISFGYRYLTETKESEEKYFMEVLSNAVTKRENNNIVNSLEYPREGYYISTLATFQNIVETYVPELKNMSEILFLEGLWYIVDAEVARGLGIKEASNYIDALDVENTEKVKVALVNYYTGDVFLFEIKGVDLKGSISGDIEKVLVDEHVHSYNIEEPTCTLDKKCLICGLVEKVALGHDYGTTSLSYTGIDDEFHYNKRCSICQAIGGYERHTYSTNGECSKCGWTS